MTPPVAIVLCPAFHDTPDVLIWRDRAFRLDGDGEYREVFSCCVFTRDELDEGKRIGAVT